MTPDAEAERTTSSAQLTERYAPLSIALTRRRLQFALAPEGMRTHTDGVTLYLRTAASDRERRIEIALQCMLLAADSFAPAATLQLVGRPILARRYLALEASRLLHGADSLTRLIVSASLALPWRFPASRAESLRLARDGQVAVDDEPLLGELLPVRLLRNLEGVERGKARPDDLRKRQRSGPEDPELGEDEDAAEDMPSLLNKFSMPFNVVNPLGDLFRKLMGARKAGASNQAPGMEIPTGTVRQARRPMPGGQRAAYSIETADTPESARLISRWTYPEWDFIAARYRPDWCVVHEIPAAWTMDRAEPASFRRDSLLERGLRRLALGIARERRQLDGDDLDLDAAIYLAVNLESDRRRGLSADARMPIYSAARRIRRDLAALLLLDISGSTAESIGGGRSVRAEQLQTAAALTYALATVGDRVATLAFHSEGRDGVRAVTLKNFDEAALHGPLSATLRLKASGYTRLGAGIRHGAHRLVHDSGVARRLLVVISDGIPYDTGYIGRYAARDVMRALDECAEQQVRVLWLCFGTMDPELHGHLARGMHQLVVSGDYAGLRGRLPAAMARCLTRSARRAVLSE